MIILLSVKFKHTPRRSTINYNSNCFNTSQGYNRFRCAVHSQQATAPSLLKPLEFHVTQNQKKLQNRHLVSKAIQHTLDTSANMGSKGWWGMGELWERVGVDQGATDKDTRWDLGSGVIA